MKLQASSIYRNTQCLASSHLENAIPYEERYNAFKDAASLGSLIHSIAERQLQESLNLTNKKITSLPSKLKKAGFVKGTYEYDKAFNSINEYVKYIKKICKRLKPKDIYLEEKFRAIVNGTDVVFKCDALTVTCSGDNIRIDIFDLKTGNFDYYTSASLQMWFSILIYVRLFLTKHEGQIETYVHVVQPNYWKDVDTIRVTNHTFCNAGEAVALIYDMVSEIKENANIFKAGDWCKMCPAILKCREGMSSLSIIHEQVTQHSLDLTKLKPDQLEAIYSRKEMIETFLKAVEQQIKTDLDNGVGYNNINVKTTKGHRKWVDPKKTERLLLRKIGTDIYEPKKLKSVAQMEKIAGKKNIEGMYEQPDIKKLQIMKSPFSEVTK